MGSMVIGQSRGSARRWVLSGTAGIFCALATLTAHAQSTMTFAAKGASVPLMSSGSLMAFWVFGALTLIGAALTISLRSPVSAALALVFTLCSTAGLYLLLHATFLAAIQVLVYAGAIMVLFIFVVMAVSHVEDEQFGLGRGLLSKLIGVVAVGVLVDRLVRVLIYVNAPAAGPAVGDVRAVGKVLFSAYLLPFEAISLLLLVAIVGAVVVTRRPPRDGSRRGGAPA